MKFAVKLPNLSITRGQVPTEGTGGPSLLRRLRSMALWGAISFAFFLVFAWLCLPTRAIAWRIGHEARKAGYIVDVKDVSVNLLGDITLEEVTWTFAPSRPDTIPSKFLIDEVEIDVSFLSLLIGNIDVDVEVRRSEGTITAHYERDSSSSAVKIEVADLPLYDVPKARQALNVPLMGLFALKVDLEMPGNKFAKANGTIEMTCAACSIGDGEEKLYIPGSKGLKDGTVIPQIDLGTFVGKMTVEKGTAKTEGPMETKSDDVEVSVEGEIDLKDPFPKSRLDLTLKLNLTKSLQDRSEKLRLVFQGADAKSRLDPPEQGLGYVLSGPLGNPKFKGIKSKSATESRAEKRAKQRAKDEKRKAKERGAKPAESDSGSGFEARPSLPGGPTPADPNAPTPTMPTAPGSTGAMPTPPMPTTPAPNGVDVQNLPPTSAVPTEPPPVDPPPAAEPPVEPAPAEPVPEPEPTPEPAPPEGEEVPTILPPDGNFGGSGGPIGEPQQ
ncbi:MAG: type II secretion system protein GspN [Myxococcales bacterium]|nr:type II secretion system protein GspN [Myxococcales bacterium]